MKKFLVFIMFFLFSMNVAQALEFTFSDKDFLGGASWGTMYITSEDSDTLKVEYIASSNNIPFNSQVTGFGFAFSSINTMTSVSNPLDVTFSYDQDALKWVKLTNANAIPNPANGDEFSPVITKFDYDFGATEGKANTITPPGIKPGTQDIFYLNFRSTIGLDDVLLTGIRLQSLPCNINGGSLFLAGKTPTAPVPEPATMLLLGSGLVGLAGFGRKKFKK